MCLRNKSKASYLYNIDTKLLLKIDLGISSASASCWSEIEVCIVGLLWFC